MSKNLNRGINFVRVTFLFASIFLLYSCTSLESSKTHLKPENLALGDIGSNIKNNEGIDDSVVVENPGKTSTDVVGYPAPPITPPSVHPRLFVRKEDIPRIKENITKGRVGKAWKRMQEHSMKEYTGILPKTDKSNFQSDIITFIQANALKYLLENNQVSADKAVDTMTNFLKTLVENETRNLGETITTAAMVYDWCYDRVTNEQRNLFREYMIKHASKMEIKYPPTKQGAITGHGSEDQLMRDLISAGIATYDEDPNIYNWAAGRFFAEYIEPRNLFYPGGMHHQGDSYGPYRYNREVIASWIFKRMGAGDVFLKDQSKVPYHWIYSRRPDGQLLRDGDTYQSKWHSVGQYWNYATPNMLASNYYQDPYISYQYLKDVSHDNIPEDIWTILFDDPKLDAKAKPESDLPLTRYFDYPFGVMIARTGWEEGMNASAVVAEMKIGGLYFGNHAHLDAGKFQLYYKGSLAIDSGVYDKYNSEHYKNYAQRTIAHNCMLVYDPAEKFIYQKQQVDNDGGQIIPNNGTEPSNIKVLLDPSKKYENAKVLKKMFGPDQVVPDFSYIKGDLTKAYSSKVKEYKRSFVFLNLNNLLHPAVLIVFDEVISSNPDYKKTWLLHSLEEPEVDGNSTTIVKTGHNYNGKLVNQTILPSYENLSLTKIGGPGKEYMVGDKNYEAKPDKNFDLNAYETGSWRIEVAPVKAAQTELFLNVMQVMDNVGGPAPLQTVAVTGDKVTGARISDRVVLFSKVGHDIEDSVTFSVDGDSRQLKFLVTDLAEGQWTVINEDGLEIAQCHVKQDQGVLYYTAEAGKYVITRQAR